MNAIFSGNPYSEVFPKVTIRRIYVPRGERSELSVASWSAFMWCRQQILDMNNTEDDNRLMSQGEPLPQRLSKQVDSLCRVAVQQGVALETLVAAFPVVQKLQGHVINAMDLVCNGMALQETSLDAVLSALPERYQMASTEVQNACHLANEVNRMNAAMCRSAQERLPSY